MKHKKNKTYQKHLSILDREDIERLLKEDFKFYQIADRLGKDATTISKEVKNNRILRKPSNFNGKTNFCKNKLTCNLQNICSSNCHTQCSSCSRCNDICTSFQLDICKKLLKPPYVCNTCPTYVQCRKIKYIYNALKAQAKYQESLSISRKGINMSDKDLQKLDNLISPLIKQGQSIKLIYRNHKDEIPCKISCLYNYIDAGLLSAKNGDLPRKVRYKPRNKNDSNTTKDYSYRENRTYDDFLELLENNQNLNIVEMDTVEGQKGRQSLINSYL